MKIDDEKIVQIQEILWAFGINNEITYDEAVNKLIELFEGN